MIETYSIDADIADEMKMQDATTLRNSFLALTGLTTMTGAILETGPASYPAPEYIDEKVNSYYIQISSQEQSIVKRNPPANDTSNPQDVGTWVEYNAQQVLKAMWSGLMPNNMLEQQIIKLMIECGVTPEPWIDTDVKIGDAPFKKRLSRFETLHHHDWGDDDKQAEENMKKMFKDLGVSSGQMRAMRSIFVEEGVNGGNHTDMTSRDVEFVVPETTTVNTAVILPLSRDVSGQVLVGFDTTYQPATIRHGSKKQTLNLPHFPLPKHVQSLFDAKKYVAEKFKIDIKMVGTLGPSFFCHIGVTPHRIYPFCIADEAQDYNGYWGVVKAHAPIVTIDQLEDFDDSSYMSKILGRGAIFQGKHCCRRLKNKPQFNREMATKMERNGPQWSSVQGSVANSQTLRASPRNRKA